MKHFLLFFFCLTGIFSYQANANKRYELLSSERDGLAGNKKFNYNTSLAEAIISGKERNIDLMVPLEGSEVILNLKRSPESDFTFLLTVDAESVERKLSDATSVYTGSVEGEEFSYAEVTLFNNHLKGSIYINDKSWSIDRDTENESVVIVPTDDLSANDMILANEHEKHLLKSHTIESASKRSLKVYFETDYGLYLHFGNNVSSVQAYVLELFDQVKNIYEREGIILQISEIKVNTSCAGVDFRDGSRFCYSSLPPDGSLPSFAKKRLHFNGDIANLLVKTSSSTTLRGIANNFLSPNQDVLCLSDPTLSSPHTVSEVNPNLPIYQFPTYTRSIMIIAHEMAHLLWGNSHYLPGCGIMSTCDLQTGGSVDFNDGFGSLVGDAIRENIDNTACPIGACNTFYTNRTDYSTVWSGGIKNVNVANELILRNVTTFSGAVFSVSAGNKIRFTGEELRLRKGTRFHAFLSNCNSYGTSSSSPAISPTLLQTEPTTSKLMVYPNHSDASNRLAKVVIDNVEENSTYSLNVIDFNGRVVWQVTSSGGEESLNYEGFKKGIYVIRLVQDGLVIDTKKIVIK